jgi:hypothetical protein
MGRGIDYGEMFNVILGSLVLLLIAIHFISGMLRK